MSMLDTEEQALINAIRVAPDDDAPRLAYADWLDEHDQADRAEFIRVQCELARLPTWKDRTTFERLTYLRGREDALLNAHYAQWASAVVRGGETKPDQRRVFFKRGFATSIVLAGQRINREWDAIFVEPCLRELAVVGIHDDDFAALVRDPRCAQMRRLAISYGFGDVPPHWHHFAESRHFDALAELSFGYGGQWTDDDAIAIGQNPALAHVQELTLDVSQQLQRAEAVLSGVAFRQLRRFTLTAFRRACSVAILRSKCLAQLQRLALNLELDATALRCLPTTDFWPHLQRLSLWNPRLDDARLQQLGQLHAPALTSFELSSNHAGNPAHLIGPLLAQVQSLTFHDVAHVDHRTLQRLADAGYAASLRGLTLLSCASVDDRVAALLASDPAFSNLCALDLRATKITEQGYCALAASQTLTKLVDVTVDAGRLTAHAKTALLERFGTGLLIPYWRR